MHHRPALVRILLTLLAVASPLTVRAADPGMPADSALASLTRLGLTGLGAHRLLQELVRVAPHRLSGSPGAEAAVQFTRRMMEERGFENVHLEEVMVPRWVRGPVEKAEVLPAGTRKGVRLAACALGGSVGTPKSGVTAEVVEVRSFEELRALGDAARGKIVFFNRPFDPAKVNPGAAYGGAVDQRSRGPVEAAKAGAVGVLVRSMTFALDDAPHTGATNYLDTVPRIPAAAVSTIGANSLSSLLAAENNVRVRLTLSAATLPDVMSANVVGDIRGWERPQEIIVIAGHLDAWDKGQGAHDDGAGCMQAIEALDLIKRAGIRPRRTIRAVMYMNEENGIRGAKAYPVAVQRKGEVQYAAMESDAGGFTPRGFSVDGDSLLLARVLRWEPLFERLNAGQIRPGGSGVDISTLRAIGVPCFGLSVEGQRYFDYHHSDNDTIDKVHPRELELGAIVLATLALMISEEGL
jgi:hypothetical protein